MADVSSELSARISNFTPMGTRLIVRMDLDDTARQRPRGRLAARHKSPPPSISRPGKQRQRGVDLLVGEAAPAPPVAKEVRPPHPPNRHQSSQRQTSG